MVRFVDSIYFDLLLFFAIGFRTGGSEPVEVVNGRVAFLMGFDFSSLNGGRSMDGRNFMFINSFYVSK